MHRLRRLLIATTASCLMVLSAADTAADAVDASVRLLSRAVTPQPAGRHFDLLRSLRSLRRSSLSPLFSRLANEDDPLIRIHGILGLAEVSPEERIDPWLVHRLDSDVSRLYAINLAIELDLVGVDELRSMLAWADLGDLPRLAILAELVRRGEPAELESISALLESSSDIVRAVAACLVADVSGDREPFNAVMAEIAELPEARRAQVRAELVDNVRRYGLDGMSWWLESLVREDSVSETLRRAAVAAALDVDLMRGVGLWEEALDRDPSYANAVHLGLILLEAAAEEADRIEAAAFEQLRLSETLPDRLADAGVALARRENQAVALIGVLELGHWRSSLVALDAASSTPVDERVEVYEFALDRLLDVSRASAESESVAARVAADLVDADPDAAAAYLEALPDDSRRQEIFLLGLVRSDSPKAAELARSVKRLGVGRADSLALLTIAKHATALTPDETSDLGVIAAGGGGLSDILGVQAAWLYMEHVDRIEHAMSRLFTPDQ